MSVTIYNNDLAHFVAGMTNPHKVLNFLDVTRHWDPSLALVMGAAVLAALFASAFNVVCGQAGMLSFGHAVYFGLDTGFNARARAKNFDPAELPLIMGELHRRGLKGYVESEGPWSIGRLSAVVTVPLVLNGDLIGGLHLWPHWPAWNDVSSMVLPVLAVGSLLWFFSAVVSLRERSRNLDLLMNILALLSAPVALGIVLIEPSLRFRLMVPYIVMTSTVAAAAVIWAARRGDRYALGLLGGMLPVIIGAAFPLARLWGLIPVNFLTMHGMQVGIAIELPVLLVILMVRSQQRREHNRRIQGLDRCPHRGGASDHDRRRGGRAGLWRLCRLSGHTGAGCVRDRVHSGGNAAGRVSEPLRLRRLWPRAAHEQDHLPRAGAPPSQADHLPHRLPQGHRPPDPAQIELPAGTCHQLGQVGHAPKLFERGGSVEHATQTVLGQRAEEGRLACAGTADQANFLTGVNMQIKLL